MGLLDRLSPIQRQALMYGVPAVAVLAVGLRIGRGNTTTDAAPADTRPGGMLAPITNAGATDVIGVGQLADFESAVTASLGNLALAVQRGPAAPTAPCAAPIYPEWKAGPVACPCPAGTTLLDDRAGNKYSCAAPNDAADFARLVANIRAGRPPY